MKTDTVSKVPPLSKLKRGAKLICVEVWREGATFCTSTDFPVFDRLFPCRTRRHRLLFSDTARAKSKNPHQARYQDSPCWYRVEVFGVTNNAFRILGYHRDHEKLTHTVAVAAERKWRAEIAELQEACCALSRWRATGEKL